MTLLTNEYCNALEENAHQWITENGNPWFTIVEFSNDRFYHFRIVSNLPGYYYENINYNWNNNPNFHKSIDFARKVVQSELEECLTNPCRWMRLDPYNRESKTRLQDIDANHGLKTPDIHIKISNRKKR